MLVRMSLFLLTNAAVAALVMVSVLVVTMPDACEDVMFLLTNAAVAAGHG